MLRLVEGAAERTDGYLEEDGRFLGYVEAAVADGTAPGVVRPIPADGNCLISALHAIRHGGLPDRVEIQRLRLLAAFGVGDEAIDDALEGIKADLIAHAGEMPFLNGVFPGCGPQLSDQLENRGADPDFTARRRKALEALRRQAAAMEARFTAQPVSPAIPSMALPTSALKAQDPLPAVAAPWRRWRVEDPAGMVALFREDLADPEHPMPLGLHLVEAVTHCLGRLSVTIAVVRPGQAHAGRPLIEEVLHTHSVEEGLGESQILLFHDGRFSVLDLSSEKVLEGGSENVPDENAEYFRDEWDGNLRGFRAVSRGHSAEALAGDDSRLISALYAFAQRPLPTRVEIAEVRSQLARNLPDQQIHAIIDRIVMGLLPNRAQGPAAPMALPGLGRRMQGLLEADNAFRESWKRAAESGPGTVAVPSLELKGVRPTGEATEPAPSALFDDLDPDLVLAIALSLGQEQPH